MVVVAVVVRGAVLHDVAVASISFPGVVVVLLFVAVTVVIAVLNWERSSVADGAVGETGDILTLTVGVVLAVATVVAGVAVAVVPLLEAVEVATSLHPSYPLTADSTRHHFPLSG
jgi:hypothetical protein